MTLSTWANYIKTESSDFLCNQQLPLHPIDCFCGSSFIMSSSFENVGKGIFLGRHHVHPFVRSYFDLFVRAFFWADLVTTISHERLEQCR